ncbi:glycosyltransferase WbuB, partial [Streptomyces spiralis]
PEAADRLGARGPAYVDERLSRAAGLGRLDDLLAEALEQGTTAHEGAARA